MPCSFISKNHFSSCGVALGRSHSIKVLSKSVITPLIPRFLNLLVEHDIHFSHIHLVKIVSISFTSLRIFHKIFRQHFSIYNLWIKLYTFSTLIFQLIWNLLTNYTHFIHLGMWITTRL